MEIVHLTHSVVRWRNPGPWRMSLDKYGQVWRKAIALLLQSSNTTIPSSLWFGRSDTAYGKLKDLVGIFFDSPEAIMVRC